MENKSNIDPLDLYRLIVFSAISGKPEKIAITALIASELMYQQTTADNKPTVNLARMNKLF